MNESAGGEDEVTLGIVKEALAVTRLDTYNILVRAWSVDETDEFEASSLRSVVIVLWLDQYWVICLLAIISRILARIVGSRILAYVEKIGLLNNSQ